MAFFKEIVSLLWANMLWGSWADPEGGGPEKSQVAVCFLRNAGTDLPQEAIGPLGSNCFSMEVGTAL